MGSCLAGDTCIFSHDPSQSASKLSSEQQQGGPRIVPTTPPPHFQMHDFPSLSPEHYSLNNALVSPPPGFKHFPGSRPLSRNQNRSPSPAIMNIPSVDDTEAFPSLGSAKVGKRGNSRRNKNHHNNNMKENDHNRTSPKLIPTGPASLAEVVGMVSPTPQGRRYNHVVAATSPPGRSASPFRRQVNIGKASNHAAVSIQPPQQIPWLDTGDVVNKMYLKHRQAAIKHGQLRNKYLQAAAQAWGRNDSKSAKTLSMKGQSEQAEMRKAHREAAAIIYEQRQKRAREHGGTEMFIDLHGLHPDEAVEYLEKVLLEQQAYLNPIYAITGTAHHSKNGKDKVQRAVRSFLDHWRYAYREFSAQGDRGGMGGILGIDPRSFEPNQVAWPGLNTGKNFKNLQGKHNNNGTSGVNVISAESVNAGGMVGGNIGEDGPNDERPVNADGQAPRNEMVVTFKPGRGRKSSKHSITPPSDHSPPATTARVALENGKDTSEFSTDGHAGSGTKETSDIDSVPRLSVGDDQQEHEIRSGFAAISVAPGLDDASKGNNKNNSPMENGEIKTIEV